LCCASADILVQYHNEKIALAECEIHILEIVDECRFLVADVLEIGDDVCSDQIFRIVDGFQNIVFDIEFKDI